MWRRFLASVSVVTEVELCWTNSGLCKSSISLLWRGWWVDIHLVSGFHFIFCPTFGDLLTNLHIIYNFKLWKFKTQLTVLHHHFDAFPKSDFPGSRPSHTVFVPSTQTAAWSSQQWKTASHRLQTAEYCF